MYSETTWKFIQEELKKPEYYEPYEPDMDALVESNFEILVDEYRELFEAAVKRLPPVAGLNLQEQLDSTSMEDLIGVLTPSERKELLKYVQKQVAEQKKKRTTDN
jgi:hypothetical protein